MNVLSQILKSKVSIALLTAISLVASMGSCTDETIGGSLADTQTKIIADSSFTITGVSLLNTHVQSRASREAQNSSARLILQLLGELKSDGYGRLRSDVVTQFMPTALVDTVGTTVETIDSCRLALRIPTQGFTGDSLVPMRLSVYRLNNQLPNPIYSDFDVSGYYDENDLLGATSYSANALMKGSTTNNLSYRTVYVPMPVSLAKDLYTKFKQDPALFNDPDNFVEYFPGVYIKNSYGSGRVMNFFDTELEMWYKKKVTASDGVSTRDTVLQQTLLTATPEVISNNNITLEPAQSVKDMIDNGEAIVMGPAGYEVNVKFPIQDVIDKFKTDTKGSLGVINTLSLTIPVELVENDCNIAPPKYLLLVQANKKESFIAGDSIPDNKTSFYATYDAARKQYVFSGMRNYILNIMDNKGGIASDDDVTMTILPVDIDFYTEQSYYYYTETSAIVSKVSPGISTPAIAKLLLDKARVKITFSRQSM